MYDALNRRVEKQTPSTPGSETTRFIYDGWRAIEERVPSDVTQKEKVRARYGFGLGLDEVLWMDRDVARGTTSHNDTDAPNPVSGEPNGTIESRFFVHQDGLGSAAAITNATRSAGALVVEERFTYSAYGTPDPTLGTWSCSGGSCSYSGTGFPSQSRVGLPYLFTGQRLDPETGYYYFKNRVYDAQTGRFLRRDLLGYRDGPNIYSYVRNPSVHVDSLGLLEEPPDNQVSAAAALAAQKAYVGDSVGKGYWENVRLWTATKVAFAWVIDEISAAGSLLGKPLGGVTTVSSAFEVSEALHALHDANAAASAAEQNIDGNGVSGQASAEISQEIRELLQLSDTPEGAQKLKDWYQRWRQLEGDTETRLKQLLREKQQEIESRSEDGGDRSEAIPPPCMPGVPWPLPDPDEDPISNPVGLGVRDLNRGGLIERPPGGNLTRYAITPTRKKR